MNQAMSAKAMRWGRRLATAGVVALALAGGASAQDEHDPYEGFNRTMFTVNETIDTYAAKPIAKGYDKAVPLPLKAGVGNFFNNAGDLWIGVNGALQGKLSDAGNDLARLLINSTVGIFGLFDVASEIGLEKHEEDFGQTLAVWGVSDGAYLYWPIIGPRTVRDTFGWGVDTFSDPVRATRPVSVRNGMSALRIVDIRASLLPADKVVEEAALDKYAYIRDGYLQRRRNLIYDGRPPRLDD